MLRCSKQRSGTSTAAPHTHGASARRNVGFIEPLCRLHWCAGIKNGHGRWRLQSCKYRTTTYATALYRTRSWQTSEADPAICSEDGGAPKVWAHFFDPLTVTKRTSQPQGRKCAASVSLAGMLRAYEVNVVAQAHTQAGVGLLVCWHDLDACLLGHRGPIRFARKSTSVCTLASSLSGGYIHTFSDVIRAFVAPWGARHSCRPGTSMLHSSRP